MTTTVCLNCVDAEARAVAALQMADLAADKYLAAQAVVARLLTRLEAAEKVCRLVLMRKRYVGDLARSNAPDIGDGMLEQNRDAQNRLVDAWWRLVPVPTS